MVFEKRDVRGIGYEDALELRVHDGKTLYDDLAQPGAADQFFRRRQIIHPVDIDADANADAIADGARVAPARVASAGVDERVRRIGSDQRQGLLDKNLLVIEAGRDLHRVARGGGGYAGIDRAEAALLLGANANGSSRGRTDGYGGKRCAQHPEEDTQPSPHVPHTTPHSIAY